MGVDHMSYDAAWKIFIILKMKKISRQNETVHKTGSSIDSDWLEVNTEMVFVCHQLLGAQKLSFFCLFFLHYARSPVRFSRFA